MTVLETERLRLRRIERLDGAFLLELMTDPDFILYVADRGLRTSADAERYIAERMLPSFEQFGFGFYVLELKDGGTPVGICGLIKRETLEDVDIGFSILRRFWRNGYAYEAAAAVLDYGRKALGLPRIVGLAAADNAKSIRLLEKLGLRYERTVHLSGYPNESKVYG